ncbi:hypothetical protein [Streptomyces sp. NPDC051684]|uniref:hypothetical protein n=1 Tax=Streptomyces sp. NPDC051684 TaxID=3365670 RepID=UPI00378C0BBC
MTPALRTARGCIIAAAALTGARLPLRANPTVGIERAYRELLVRLDGEPSVRELPTRPLSPPRRSHCSSSSCELAASTSGRKAGAAACARTAAATCDLRPTPRTGRSGRCPIDHLFLWRLRAPCRSRFSTSNRRAPQRRGMHRGALRPFWHGTYSQVSMGRAGAGERRTDRLIRTPRQKLIVLSLLAVAVAFGWYAARPVHPSSCVVFSGAYVPLDASPEELDAANQRTYDKALAAGACGPAHARFRGWFD